MLCLDKVSEQKDVGKAVEEHRENVRKLRAELSQVGSVLSSQQRSRRSLGKEIASLLGITKKLRSERNQLTAQVKEKKESRKKLNDEIVQKISSAKALNAKKKEAGTSFGESPGRLRQQIDLLNTKIETEVISFETEKALMRKIHDLKKKLAQAVQGSQLWDESHALSKEIDGLKENADRLHKEITEQAALSQQKHEVIVANSQKIDELRKKEAELEAKIQELQQQFDKISESLQSELKALSDLTGMQEELNQQEKRLLKEAEQKKLAEMKKAIEEKLKRGEKVTTQDLLVLQG